MLHYSIFSYIYAFVLSLRSPGACSLQDVLGIFVQTHKYARYSLIVTAPCGIMITNVGGWKRAAFPAKIKFSEFTRVSE